MKAEPDENFKNPALSLVSLSLSINNHIYNEYEEGISAASAEFPFEWENFLTRFIFLFFLL